MPECYDYEWYCLTHNCEFERKDHSPPERCPQAIGCLEFEDDEPESCEITTIGEHREAMAIPEPEDRERSTFWDGR